MKSLMLLLNKVITECGDRCSVSTDADFKKASIRFEHEGLSFLTITLSDFGSDFEKSLDSGSVDPSSFAGFQRRGGLPLFLGGFLDQVFDRGTGRLLDKPSIDAIQCVRQITLMWKKIEIDCTPARTARALDKYIQCESEVKIADARFPEFRDSFERMRSVLLGQYLSDVDLAVYNGELMPKHGPGSTADRLLGNKKWKQMSWPIRSEYYFPMGKMVFPSYRYYVDNMDRVNFLEPGSELPVKVITVPKTLKTPRIIAVEPTCMQYMQQSVLAVMSETLRLPEHSALSRMISSDDQTPNQRLARIGSRNGSYATLDLSEASDRVSNEHVRSLLKRHPHLSGAVDSSRSRKARVLGQTIRLAKFASMGSALCFPFEALVFLTVVFLGIEKVLNRPLTQKDVKRLSSRVRVYGDDIIVPVEYTDSVYESLQSFGFKVNSSKSFWTGKFRESCGKEYYDGVDVSITKLRRLIPTTRKRADEVVSFSAFRNLSYKAGYREVAHFCDTILERIIPYPRVAEDSPVLGRHEDGVYDTESMCDDLQRPLVWGVQVRTKLPEDKLSDYPALHKWFMYKGRELFDTSNLSGKEPLGQDHLLRAGRAVAVDIKHGWYYSN